MTKGKEDRWINLEKRDVSLHLMLDIRLWRWRNITFSVRVWTLDVADHRNEREKYL